MGAARALVVVVALVAGCKDDAIEALESARSRVCECKDATCVNAAMDAMQDHPTKHQRKAEAIAREIMDCVARVYQQTDARVDEPDAEVELSNGTGSGSATSP
jgi:entry exclusion lipoprotein TrbK